MNNQSKNGGNYRIIAIDFYLLLHTSYKINNYWIFELMDVVFSNIFFQNNIIKKIKFITPVIRNLIIYV